MIFSTFSTFIVVTALCVNFILYSLQENILNNSITQKISMIQESFITNHGTQQHHEVGLSKTPEDYFVKQAEFNLGSIPVATQYLGSDAFACVGCEDGLTYVLSSSKWNVQYKLINDDKTPVMGLSSSNDLPSGIRNSVMVVHNGGTMQYWHTTSQQLLFSKKYEHSLQSCEISPNGEWYAISGENGNMLLGHLNKGEPKSLETGHLGSHGNRVFCIKWDPSDPNIFYSGGWDNTVFFWDVRTRTSFNKLYGIYMGGQAIDIKSNQLLIGNNKNENRLKLYDLKAGNMRVIRWQNYTEQQIHSTVGVNSCFFGQDQTQIIALSSRNEVRIIREQSCMSLYSHPDKAKGYSMAKNKNQKQVVTAWSNGDIKILKY